MNKWDLLHIGTTYVGVHTFKWKDYVTVRDFNTTTNALSKEILELEEENKKLREYNWELIENHKKDIAILCEENKKLKSDLEEVKNDLEHRDSFFSIMRDVLANKEISNEELANILYCVIHFECGDTDMSKKEVEIAEKFWYRDYV